MSTRAHHRPVEEAGAAVSRTLGRRLEWLGWASALGLVVLLLFAHVWPQSFSEQSTAGLLLCYLAFMVRTFQFHAGLGAALLCAVALLKRRRALAAMFLLTVLAGVLPEVRGPAAPQASAPAGARFTVLSANLLSDNRHTASFVQEVRQAAPDLLLLQECSDHWHDVLQEAVGHIYPYRRRIPRDDPFGSAIYSRRPLVQEQPLLVPLGRWSEDHLRVVVRVGTRRVVVYNLHLMPPNNLSLFAESRRQLVDLLQRITEERDPVVVAGDFNFTPHSVNAAALRSAGLREAHALAGRGRGTTWPVMALWRAVPGLRIDHIFVGPELTVLQARTGVGRGSDHRPVIAELAFED